jgi:hypothetical protein
MMKPLFAALFAASLLVGPGLAAAGDVTAAATRAEDLAAAGNYEEALAAIDEAKEVIWKAAPLTFRRALFVASDPQGFGIFDIRENAVFRKSEQLIIYSEPVGFGYGRDGNIYTIDLTLDFVIRGVDGKEVAKQENFGTLSLRSRVPNKEFMAKVTYNFSGLPAGDYEVTTVARDKSTGKSGQFALKFTLTD